MAKVIEGNRNEQRTNSRVLDEEIREAIREGSTEIHVVANGQHGIGGRLWGFPEPVTITVEGPVGQRLGGMGISGTTIVVRGSVSDDVGWLNCGAEITVLGDAGNGAHNAAAQGKLYVQGSGGARCDTMTKHNPKHDPPQSWYFRDVGDTFAEFKAGGIAVICGVEPRSRNNIIGYRPCVGMVGGVVYFRGPIEGYSESDVRLLELTPQDWQWLKTNMRPFLRAIEREEHYRELTKDAGAWRKLIPFTAREREKTRPFTMSPGEFRKAVWEAGVGAGGIFAEYIDHPRTVLPYITTGQDRRFRPSWNNGKYAPPCEYTCPSGIPTWQRTRLIREGKLSEALELVLRYSPLPASVCGEVCAHLCMQGCTRALVDRPLDTEEFGKASLELPLPQRDKPTGRKVAVIGAGAGGLSAAWQLSLRGHSVDSYEARTGSEANWSTSFEAEVVLPRPDHGTRPLQKRWGSRSIPVSGGWGRFDEIYAGHDAVSRYLRRPQAPRAGHEGRAGHGARLRFPPAGRTRRKRLTSQARRSSSSGKVGNVGMDVAAEAFRPGAAVTAVDIQRPAAFGKGAGR